MKKLISNFTTLEEISTTISNGISTSCDKVYIVNGETVKKHKIEHLVAKKKSIRGSNFNRYWIDDKVDDFVVYI